MQIPKAFKGALNSTDKFLVLYGGAGSGKSYFATQKIIVRVLSEVSHQFLVVRKVAATLRNSVWDLFIKVIYENELEDNFDINKSNFEITCKLNGNKIIFKGLDNPEKIKSIAGITGIWVEEATELTQEDLDQLELRLRGITKNYKQFIITFNPVSAKHWIKRRFFDALPKDTLTIKTTYLDNPFIDEEYKKVFERLKRDNFNYYKIYALGEWGNLKGVIYQDYKVIEELPKYYEKEYIGLDFGYNHPYAIVRTRINKRDIFVDELFYQREWENKKVIEYLETHYSWIKRITMYADSARADLISEFRARGFDIQKANKSVFEGINTVKSFNLHFTKRSVNLLKEADLYVWKENKEGNTLDEPIKANDDGMDALRYSLTPYIHQKGSTKTIKVKYL